MPLERPGILGMAMTFRESMITCSEPESSSGISIMSITSIQIVNDTGSLTITFTTASFTHEMVLVPGMSSTEAQATFSTMEEILFIRNPYDF